MSVTCNNETSSKMLVLCKMEVNALIMAETETLLILLRQTLVYLVFQALVLEGRFSALEAQVESLLSGLDRLSILEKRLETLEKLKNTNKVDETIASLFIVIYMIMSKLYWYTNVSLVLSSLSE